jgi:PAS domain S-box-containing protein
MSEPSLQSRDADDGMQHHAVDWKAVKRMPDLVLDAIRDHAIFTLDTEGRISSWNTGARRITGYVDAEVLGQPYSIFGAQDMPGDTARILQTAYDTGCYQQERWWRRRDAGLVWVEELINPLDGIGYVVVTRDLTERAEAEERELASRQREEQGTNREVVLRRELQAAERRAAFLAEASSILVATSLDFGSTLKALARLAVSRLADWCAIHSYDHDGRLVRSEVAHRDPRLDQALDEVADAALNEQWRQTVQSVASTGRGEILDQLNPAGWLSKLTESDVVRQLGHGTAMVTPLMGRGNVLGAMTFVMTEPDREYDEDDIMLAEELGRRAAIALDNARLYNEAQEANRAKADFLAVMSHELRTPLNAIMGYTDLLDAEVSGGLTDKQRRQLDRIRASARHLLQLIEEILSFARIESGGEEVRLEVVEVSKILDEAAAAVEPMAQSKGLTLDVEFPEDDVVVETDGGKVRQILVNLLSNAVKFTERGGVTLRARADSEHVEMDVVDTGVGIPADQLGRIFDPFWQVERPNTRKAGGTGLGLSVSRRYIRLLRGEISVRSEPGRGTTFTVSIPLRLTGAHTRR